MTRQHQSPPRDGQPKPDPPPGPPNVDMTLTPSTVKVADEEALTRLTMKAITEARFNLERDFGPVALVDFNLPLMMAIVRATLRVVIEEVKP